MSDHRRKVFETLFSKSLKLSDKKWSGSGNFELVYLFMISQRGIDYPTFINALRKVPRGNYRDLLKIIFFIRSPRGGRGERLLSRFAYQWLLINSPEVLIDNLSFIPEYGRWDDIFYLFPGAVNLTDLNFVRKNYLSNVSETHLDKSKKAQIEVVNFVCNKFLEFFHLYMEGKKGFELFVKWLPLENGSVNKKFKIVQTICDKLQISLKDYRVIYLSPMRSKSNICERNMCTNSWNSINYNLLPNEARKKHSNAFSRHDTKRYRKWKKSKKKLAYLLPQNIIDQYISNLLSNDKSKSNEYLELEWQKILRLIADFTTERHSIFILDTGMDLYHSKKNIRFLSYALSIVLVNSCKSLVSRHSINLFLNNEKFWIYKLNTSLFDCVSKLRKVFTKVPTVEKMINKAIELKSKTFIYIKSNTEEVPLGNLKSFENKDIPRIVIWYLTDNTMSYKEEPKEIFHVRGFNNEIFLYFLIHGDFDPFKSLTCILEK